MREPTENRMAVIITRYTARPLHKQYMMNLEQKKVSWKEAGADLYVALHGPSDTPALEGMRVLDAKNLGNIKDYWDYRDNTTGRIPEFIYILLTRMKNTDYDYVCFLDDDAVYRYPTQAVRDMLRAFDYDDTAGSVGPMGDLRCHWRYGGEPNFMELLHRCPWATIGSQCYRMDAIKQIPIHKLPSLKFRADAYISLLLYGFGWKNYEMNLKFHHTVSGGLNALSHTPDFHRQRIRAVGEDYEIYRQAIEHYFPADPSLRGFLHEQCRKLEHSERKHHERKLVKMNATY